MVAEPVCEDWGTVLEVRLPEPYLLSIHWAPGHQIENRWGIQFSRPVGCLGLLLGKRSSPKDCRKAQSVIAELLAQDPEVFTDVEWLSQLEYHRRM
ncbi:hypothetical protein [Zavarzinella formosa]|uniref:hypothetical protein n=1 Tax=Zavarzinella formosa TaxID=360055 RepID=UPI0002E2A5D1|nr:hypothetical protein [Zavarzinella formosa]